MKIRILALLVVLAMVACLISGCGKTQETDTTAETQTETGAEPAAEPAAEDTAPETEPAAEPAEAGEAEPAAEAETETETVPPEPAVTITYPLENNETITGWFSFFGALDSFIPSSDYNDMYIIPYIEEAAGVTLEFITVSDTIASEQYKLMVASGDWPDYTNCTSGNYSGGLLQAYEDDVILEISDEELQNNAPDYYAVLKNLSDEDMAYALNDGMNLGVYSIKDELTDEQGMVTRTDWYDEQGIEITDLTSFTDYLYACYNAYGGDTTLHVEEGGNPGYLDDAFGVTIPSYAASSLPIYVDGDTVYTSLTSDAYYEYLQWFRQLYTDKIINSEFYNRSMMTYMRFNYIAQDEIAVWPCNAGSVHDQNIYLLDNHPTITSLPLKPVTDGDGVNNWAAYMSVVGNCYTISADTPHEDYVIQYLNYFYTVPGALMGNYGVEGYTYEIDENGDPYYTDLIVNNEFSTMPENAVRGYMDQIFALHEDGDRLWCTYDDEMYNAASTWSSAEKSFEHAYPQAASLTTDEQATITNQVNDIMTHVSTEILSFMTGNTDLNEETWSTFKAELDGMGLPDVLTVYQNAYDEAKAGER